MSEIRVASICRTPSCKRTPYRDGECWLCPDCAATFAALRARLLAVEAALRACMVAMVRWGAEEDGMPEEPLGAFEAYEAAEKLVGKVWAGYGPEPAKTGEVQL